MMGTPFPMEEYDAYARDAQERLRRREADAARHPHLILEEAEAYLVSLQHYERMLTEAYDENKRLRAAMLKMLAHTGDFTESWQYKDFIREILGM